MESLPIAPIFCEQEIARVSSIWGVEIWEEVECDLKDVIILRSVLRDYCDVMLRYKGNLLISIRVGDFRTMAISHILIWGLSGKWLISSRSCFDVMLARGLYLLGFEEREILDQLPELSEHEKMELRLDLSREFWPKNWLEEVNGY